MRSLYICYFSVKQPLVQTQVIPYLLEIAKMGTALSLLTFEPDPGEDLAAIGRDLAENGVKWHWLRYHKKPSAVATAYDVFRGALLVRKIINSEGVDILHGRVHIPTLMGALGRRISTHKPKLLFDIRGFFPEEYTDAGVWPEGGWLFRAAKRVERWLLKESDGFVVLTEKARDVLFPESRATGFDVLGRPVEVIPCCVDFQGRFARTVVDSDHGTLPEQLDTSGRYVIAHVGALGGLYLTEEIADFLAAAKSVDPRVFALFLTQTDQRHIIRCLESRGFTKSDYFIGKVRPDHVPEYLAKAQAGLSFVKSSFATVSRSPTKIAEYLACGLPLVSNRGIGDVDSLISDHHVGVLVDDFSSASYVKAFNELRSLGDIGARCKQTARAGFDLGSIGGERYRRIYKRLVDEDVHRESGTFNGTSEAHSGPSENAGPRS